MNQSAIEEYSLEEQSEDNFFSSHCFEPQLDAVAETEWTYDINENYQNNSFASETKV